MRIRFSRQNSHENNREICTSSDFDKKWFHKVELLEAHSQTVYTNEIYLLGLRPRKASGAARPPLSFRLCYGLRGVLRSLKLTTRTR